ncbi:MAG: hypothetical protein QW156_04610 [Candidatus Aenigmatarchaeota archaeon]
MIELYEELGSLEGRRKRMFKRMLPAGAIIAAGAGVPIVAIPAAIATRKMIKARKRKIAKKKTPIARPVVAVAVTKPSIPYKQEAVTPEYEEERPIMEQETEIPSPLEVEAEERPQEEETTPEQGGEGMEGIEIYGLDGLDKSLWQRIKAIGKRVEKQVVRPAIQKVTPSEKGEIPALAPEQPQVIPQVEEGISKYLPYILIAGGVVLVLTMFRRHGKLSEYSDYGCGCG